MFYRGRDKLAVLYRRLEHLRDWCFVEDAVFLTLDGEVDVDATALGRRDLHSQTVL